MFSKRVTNWFPVLFWRVANASSRDHRVQPCRRSHYRPAKAVVAIVEPLEMRALLSGVAPTVTTPTSSNVTSTSVTLGGNVTFDGGNTLTSVGVLYSMTSINSNPQQSGVGVTQLTAATVTGLFTVNISNLTPGTSYSFVAFATNGVGTTYTSVLQFTTGPNHGPTFVKLPSGPNSPLYGTTGAFSVLGDDVDTGEASLTYSWIITGNIPAPVTFSDNNTNSAKNTTMTFVLSGVYDVSVTISDPTGASRTHTLIVRVNTEVTNLSFSLYDVPTLPLPYGGTDTTLIAPGIAIYDPSSSTLIQATVQATGNYVNGRDVLDATPISGITEYFDVTTGTLTLSGTSSFNNYEAVLQSLTFRTNYPTPNPLTESLTITLYDGKSTNPSSIRNITVNSGVVSGYPIACLGDSLTYWTGGWISNLQSYYSTTNVTNFGVGGYTSQQVYDVWTRKVRNSGYKMISVLAGVNDIGHGTDAATAFSFLDRLYDEALADGLKIVVFSVTPLGGWIPNSTLHWTPQMQVQLDLLNSMIASKAAANPDQMTFCDTYKLLGDPKNPQQLNSLYDNGDELHWNLAGHQLVASTFYTAFSNHLGLSGMSASGTYVQGASTLGIASNVVVTDPGSRGLSSAKVSFTNWQDGDRVAFDNNFALQHSFTEDLVAHAAMLTITGSETPLHYQATLQSLIFWNVAGQTNSAVTRNVTITVNNQYQGVSVTEKISVLQFVTGVNGTLNYLQGSVPLLIAATLVLIPPANVTTVTSATVTVTNWQAEDRLSFYNSLAFQHTFSEGPSAHTATLTITGSAPALGWNKVLSSVDYQDVAGMPNTSAVRVATFTVSNGVYTVSASENVAVVPVNQPPLVQVNDTADLRYQINSSPIAIMSKALVSDPDSNNLLSLTIQITTGYQSGNDILSFVNQLGITGAFNTTLGVLTLSGGSYVGNYRQALRAVTFNTIGAGTNSATRTFTVIAIDETNVPSNPVARSLDVTS